MGHLLLRLIRFYRRISAGPYGWSGDHKNWQEAQKKCEGYDADAILEKVKTATLKVKTGEAVYERDARLLDKTEYSWPLLANLLWIASQRNNNLSVLDFGGSLGTSYFQNRRYLRHLNRLNWSVTEQKNFVDAGRKEIANDQLRFYYNAEEVIADRGLPDVLVMSCVLPYLERPYEVLNTLLSKKIPYLIIDNTYFNPKKGNRLTIQKVPPIYYKASYPAWFLDYDEIKETLVSNYEILEEYTNDQFLYFYGEKVDYRGLIMKSKI